MAKHKFLNTTLRFLGSFIFGFVFIFFLLIIGVGFFLSKDINKVQEKTAPKIELAVYSGPSFSITYPKNYQLYENKIMTTLGIIDEQKNTIQLISPAINDKKDNASLIIAYMPYSDYHKENDQSSTCPALYKKKLTPIKIGNQTFTQSGQIFCGPNEVAFFYLLKNNTIYEVKVESSADFEKEVLPEVKSILESMKIKENE